MINLQLTKDSVLLNSILNLKVPPISCIGFTSNWKTRAKMLGMGAMFSTNSCWLARMAYVVIKLFWASVVRNSFRYDTQISPNPLCIRGAMTISSSSGERLARLTVFDSLSAAKNDPETFPHSEKIQKYQ